MKINTLSDYLKNQYHKKVYKLSISLGCTCPNRDGKLSTGGCIFCSQEGSGDFTYSNENIRTQIELQKKLVANKIPKSIPENERLYIANFQSFTNTYGNQQRLMEIFSYVAQMKEIVIISIGTRPDCITDEMLEFLSSLNKIKPVWIELGLQTIHDSSAEYINRCYKTSVFFEMYEKLKKKNLYVVVHIILGLPCETKEMTLKTVKALASLNPTLDGIKLHLLHILENSALGEMYKSKPFKIFTLDEYCNLIIECLRLLKSKTVIHRMTGDGYKKYLIEPQWSANKKCVLNSLNKAIKNAPDY